MTRQCLIFLLLLAALVSLPSGASCAEYGKDVTVSLCFTPGSNCTDKIIREIASARSEILIQAYSFTSAPIAKALIEAHKRGVKVGRSSTRASARRNIPPPLSWRT